MPPPDALGPLAFLRRQPPFDRLGEADLRRIEDALEVSLAPGGEPVLRRGSPRAEHLFVIRKGAVRLERDGDILMTLEEGDCFGAPSLLARASPLADAVPAGETLLYRLPAAVFAALMQSSPGFAEFFLLDLAARLRRLADATPAGLGSGLGIPVRRLAGREPVWIAAGATAGDAARRMRDAGTGAVLVATDAPGMPDGILTDRDLRTRVLAAGHGPELPITRAITRPVLTLPAGASLFEALLFMLEHQVRHAPLAEEGRIVGMLADGDLLRQTLRSPLHLLREVGRLREPRAAAGYAQELGAMVESLAWGGAEAAQIGRIVARLNDALTASLLRLAEAELGPPPCAYAWIVLGSEGRMEQALLTDQDNALVWEEDRPDAAAYFARLAERGVAGLLAAGIPPCPGGFMATGWHRPLAAWQRTFERWVEEPRPPALVEASGFFDFRRVHGSLDLAPLDRLLVAAGREELFMARLAQAALGFRPPLGLFHQLRAAPGGTDLKAAGILPIVGLARLYALAAGSLARPTLERLPAAAAAGALSADGAATLAEAFRFLLRLRLGGQLAAVRRGEAAAPPGPVGAAAMPAAAMPATNPAAAPAALLHLEELSTLERRHVKEVFLVIRDLQEATARRFGADRLA